MHVDSSARRWHRMRSAAYGSGILAASVIDADRIFESKARPTLADYEWITQLPFYRGQMAPIARWITGKVLDIGSSYGRFSSVSGDVVSLDIDRESLHRGVVLGNVRQPVEASATDLPFRPASFDTILCIGIIEQIPPISTPRFLDELTRVAKHGSHLVMVATSPYALFALLRIRLWGEHLHPSSPFRLRSSLLRRGWGPAGWISTGLVGMTRILPRTVAGPVPWARTITQLFVRS